MSSSLLDRFYEMWDWYRPEPGEQSLPCEICGKFTPDSVAFRQRRMRVCPHCYEEPSWVVDEEDKI